MVRDRAAAMRQAYQLAGLSEHDLAADPVMQFDRWFADAIEAGLPEPNAMVLATADAAGRPSVRMVLLKGYGAEGFIFYTNYGSRKAQELAANPSASVLFPWHSLGRQVIIGGRANRTTAAESAAYFHTRPYDSRIGAWASRQSEIIGSRAPLEQRYIELAERWPNADDVPVPDFWGGYRLRPDVMEFWQGRPGRLHDRLRYRRSGEASWVVERLAP